MFRFSAEGTASLDLSHEPTAMLGAWIAGFCGDRHTIVLEPRLRESVRFVG